MPDGRPYGPGPAAGGGDARQRKLMQVSQGFLNQGPAAAGAGPRTNPSMYPDVRGFASTAFGKILLRNIMSRKQGPRRPSQPARR